MLIYFDLCKMTPQDFSSWTREQWLEFDQIRTNTFAETPQEKTAREATERQQTLLQVQQKLATV
jgi:hypothetical protein